MKAVQNREWDSEKKEEDYNPSSLPRYRRGAHGAVTGGKSNNSRPGPAGPMKDRSAPATQLVTEWPELPGSKSIEVEGSVKEPTQNDDGPSDAVTGSKVDVGSSVTAQSPTVENASWADQVADNAPATSKS